MKMDEICDYLMIEQLGLRVKAWRELEKEINLTNDQDAVAKLEQIHGEIKAILEAVKKLIDSWPPLTKGAWNYDQRRKAN